MWRAVLISQSESDKQTRAARWLFYRVVGVWFLLTLILAVVAVFLLVNYTAFAAAYTRNAADKQTAAWMLDDYCTRPVHAVNLDEVHRVTGTQVNCTWADQTRVMNLIEQSLLDAKAWNLGVLEPRRLAWILGSLFVASLAMPFLAAVYYFRQVRLAMELARKAHEARPSLSQRVSLSNFIGLDSKPHVTWVDRNLYFGERSSAMEEQIPEIRLFIGVDIAHDPRGDYAILVNHRVKLTFPLGDQRSPVILSERRFVVSAEEYLKTTIDNPAKIIVVNLRLAELKRKFPGAKSDTKKFEHLDNSKVPFWVHAVHQGQHAVYCSVCRQQPDCACPEGKGAPKAAHPHLKRPDLCKTARCFIGDYGWV
jgi:hypothetical protein